jgi:hypothetical protein
VFVEVAPGLVKNYPVVFVCICEREDTPLPVFPGLLNT